LRPGDFAAAGGGGPLSPVACGECVDDGESASGFGVGAGVGEGGVAGADVPGVDAQCGGGGVDGVDDGESGGGGRDGGDGVGGEF
jgi:hypothetical protein